jgi:hypothetical protein
MFGLPNEDVAVFMEGLRIFFSPESVPPESITEW